MPYKTLGMLHNAGLEKDMGSGVAVPYQSEATRHQFQVSFDGGVLRWKSAILHTVGRNFIYVMDGEGRIYTAPTLEVQHHSAFLAGQPAAAAGHWIVENGSVVSMDCQSGHYQPSSDYCDQAIAELKRNGAPVDQIETDFGPSSKECIIAFKKRAKIKGLKWYQIETGAREKIDYLDGAVVERTGEKIEIGRHIRGQRLRLYPGEKPRWEWF